MFRLLLITTIIIATIFLASPVWSYTYELLEPLPEGVEEISSTGNYFSNFFRFALGLAAVLAVIMVIIAGLQYIGSGGNESVVTDAKDRIYSAIGGLILALSSVLILQSLGDDKFLNLKLNVDPTNIEVPDESPSEESSTSPDNTAYYCLWWRSSGVKESVGSIISIDKCEEDCENLIEASRGVINPQWSCDPV